MLHVTLLTITNEKTCVALKRNIFQARIRFKIT